MKAGISVKYLAGLENTFIDVDRFQGTLNYDNAKSDFYLSNTMGHIVVSSGGVNLNSVTANELTQNNGSGLGADIGFVYEYRPEIEKYRSG